MPALLGVFEFPMPMTDAIKKLRARGYTDLDFYSPVPSHELDYSVDDKPSGVRLYTLIGGLVGVCTGYAMTIWMANDWQIMIGGKPFSSIPPYTIIAFELTILFGGLMTLLGLIVKARLPHFKLDAAYSRRFSSDEFGIVVRCRERDIPEIDGLMRGHGAVEVLLVDA